ncbi:MAG: patatin-like phospholipase family protein [Actinomycetales bacterium]|nr:patatin-like phospholipase family protein [Actinomycetales bacterium]
MTGRSDPSDPPMSTPAAPRRGLVLGGGGVLGGAWLTGALHAIESQWQWDLQAITTVLGTSAGSVVGALIAGGASAEDMVAHQHGRRWAAGALREIAWDYETAVGGQLPPRPHLLGPSSPRLLADAVRRLPFAPAVERRLPSAVERRLPDPIDHPLTRGAVIAGLIPAGRGSLAALRDLGDRLQRGSTSPVRLRVTAMNLDSGALTVFGAPGAPVAGWGDALAASCAIPGWFAPVRIHGVRYVDGGAVSTTNADQLIGCDLTEAVVIVPSGTTVRHPPTGVRERVSWRWRTRITVRARAEAARLAADGVAVTLLIPGEEDLEVLGRNSMAAGRRLAVMHTAMRTVRGSLTAGGSPLMRGVPVDGRRS